MSVMTPNNNNSTNILEIKDLCISFFEEEKWHQVLHGIDLSLEKGKVLGLVGESGSGKSVTSLSIMGLLPVKISRIDRGNIFFGKERKDLAQIKSDKIYQEVRGKQIAMIFQEPMTALNPVMRCGNQIIEIIKLHNKNITKQEAKTNVINLFNEVLLPNPQRIFNAYPHQISGGQKQRVMIAMALACNPQILIADEPTTALDATIAKTIIDLLNILQQKRNLSVLFITHDLGVIRKIADKVAVLYKGCIVEQGETESIFSNPQHFYTKALIACRPPKNERPLRLFSINDFVNSNPQSVNVSSIQRKQQHEKLYSQTPLLKVNNLTVCYKQNVAVNNVSFDVYKGETLGLVGESGCGKTTVGRSILQLIDNKIGQIIFNGSDLSQLSKNNKQWRQKIQIIFQDPYSSLNPRMKIGKMLEEVLNVHNVGIKSERKECVMQILERVGLEREHYYRYAHQFSGGQRQRIGIARALILEPELIICDESVSALDLSVQAQILNLLNDLKRERNLTYIFISHDLSVVKFMSDRLLVMRTGQIIESGEADKVYSSPENKYTQTLISAAMS
jgi:peptide/nickel transport system ATP-binding protein